jgi:hypothetical protein
MDNGSVAISGGLSSGLAIDGRGGISSGLNDVTLVFVVDVDEEESGRSGGL